MTKLLISLISLSCATGVYAQNLADAKLSHEVVADSIIMVSGPGGNVGLVTGDERTFLIDDQYAELGVRIEAYIATLTDRPVDFVVNTHWHLDHSGSNAHFGEHGAVIVAHDNVRNRMATDQLSSLTGRTTKASPRAALPVVTFAESVTFHLNGKTLRVQHLPNAHTDGDAVVHFVEDNVLHTGDIFFNGMYPFIDYSSGGTLRGTAAAVDKLLAMSDTETKIIPGHGPIATRQELRNYRDFLTTMADALEAMIADGNTLEDIIAAKPTAAFDATLNRAGYFTPERWLTLIHSGLSAR